MKRTLLGASFAVVLTTSLAMAGDAPFTRVALLLPGCEPPGLGGNELREAVRLELAAEGIALAPPGELSRETDALVRVELSCSDAAVVLLAVETQAQTRQRRLELDELPATQRARALSLALAELLATLGSEPIASAPPASPTTEGLAAPSNPSDQPAPRSSAASAPPTSPPPPAALPAPAPAAAPRRDAPGAEIRPSSRLDIGLAPQLRVFDGTALWGGRGKVSRFPWSLGGDALATSSHVSAGDVTTVLAHVTVGHDTELVVNRSGWALGAGPRLGAGIAGFVVSEAANARGAGALDVYLDAALTTWLAVGSNRFRAVLSAEVGYARGPAGRADGIEVARTYGPFAGFALGASGQP